GYAGGPSGLLVGLRPLVVTLANAFDESGAGEVVRASHFVTGHRNRFARAPVRHLCPVSRPRNNPMLHDRGLRHRRLRTLWFIVKGCARLGEHDAAVGAVNTDLVTVQTVRGNSREDQRLPLGIAIRDLHVVMGFAPVLPKIDSAAAHHRLGQASKNFVGEMNMMRAELRNQASRILPIKAPVDQTLQLRVSAIRNRTTPAVVAMPVGMDLHDAADLARTDAAQGLRIPWSVMILVADLEVFPGALHCINDAVALVDRKRQALLSVNVFACFQRRPHLLRMEGERSGDDYGVHTTNRQEFVVITVQRRVFPGDLAPGGKTRLVHVTKPGKAHSRNAQEGAHQLLAPAANADDSKIDLVGGRLRPKFSRLRQQPNTSQRASGAAYELPSFHLACSTFGFKLICPLP